MGEGVFGKVGGYWRPQWLDGEESGAKIKDLNTREKVEAPYPSKKKGS